MSKNLHVHFMGIGGSGASAIAAIAQAQGFEVSGCDKNIENEYTKTFNKKQLFQDHNPNHLENVDILALSPAVLASDNKEIERAREKRIRVMTWQEFMGEFLEKDKFVVAVCGTHGKSTTTSMIAKVLTDADFDPTVEVGAIIPESGVNYRIGQSQYFVTEADEFNDNFLVTHPDIAVVTRIEMDHPEYFADFEAYKTSFIKFLCQTKQLIVANLEDPVVAEVIKIVMKETSVTCIDYSKSEFNLELKVPGQHNLMNAKAAFQVGLNLGIEPAKIHQSLEDYQGIGRRFEFLGQYQGSQIYSDYGHHPTEMRVTLEATREKFPAGKILLVFQPHMFSRTKRLFVDFVEVLKSTPIDQIRILDIFPSREVDTGLVHSRELVEASGKESVQYLDSPDNLREVFKEFKPNVAIFMGAGSVDKFARELIHG